MRYSFGYLIDRPSSTSCIYDAREERRRHSKLPVSCLSRKTATAATRHRSTVARLRRAGRWRRGWYRSKPFVVSSRRSTSTAEPIFFYLRSVSDSFADRRTTGRPSFGEAQSHHGYLIQSFTIVDIDSLLNRLLDTLFAVFPNPECGAILKIAAKRHSGVVAKELSPRVT